MVRFAQITEDKCIIDSSFNGLHPVSNYTLCLHEYGDLSKGAESTGDIYHIQKDTTQDKSERKTGCLGLITTDETGGWVKKIDDDLIKVHNIIGRSVVLHENDVDHEKRDLGKGVAYGIVARSAGLFQNDKKVCTCSGKTIWQEREEIRNETG